MTARRAIATLVALVALTATAWWGLSVARPDRAGSAPTPEDVPQAIVATLRGEPATFNRYSGIGFPAHLVSLLTHARLARINRVTQALEPWLADRWTRSDDGLRYRLHLREGVVFSDGHPFTADDVVFSFDAVYDPETASPLADALKVAGKPLTVTALNPHEVELVFPAPWGPGLRMLDALPIYPKHRLEPARAAHLFRKAWDTTTPGSEMAGLGPFVIDRFMPGQRILLSRNPHYWRRDDAGRPLPYLDRLTLEVVPDQSAELLRLRAGQADVLQGELRPEDYLPVKQDADHGRVRLTDVGPGLDTHMLWFNLTPAASADNRRWLRRDEFRQAIAHAVDRQQFARTVYLGAAEPAWSPISPANTAWFDPAAPKAAYDQSRSRALLAGLGLRDDNGDGHLEDESGAPVRFTLLVQKGVAAGEKGAAVLSEALAPLGVSVDIVALDQGALMTRWSRGDYDAIYHLIMATDTDPGGNLDLWLSSGAQHLWNPGQKTPATEWERRLDDLMQRQAGSLDEQERRRLFNEAQGILAEHLPLIVFAVPHVYIATSARLSGDRPAVQRPQVLWDPDTLSVTAGPAH
jgi:peptide/nickel transport system substrate-binding protein